MINIEKNVYIHPTEIRDEVVQGICEAFINQCVNSIYHPFSGGSSFRSKKIYIAKRKGTDKFTGFYGRADYEDYDYVRFNGCEMRKAFDVLVQNGWYIYRVYAFGTWLGYVVRNNPNMTIYDRQPVTKVTSFNEEID